MLLLKRVQLYSIIFSCITGYHTNNGIFAEKAFRNEVDDEDDQSISNCAVGAHNQKLCDVS